MDSMPVHDLMLPVTPKDIPNLVSFWRFIEAGEAFTAEEGEAYTLKSQSGPLKTADGHSSLGEEALMLEEGQWLSIPRRECPRLDFHGRRPFTLLAWICRARTRTPQCEFIAGQWNESDRTRQYGLFLNIIVWGSPDRVFGHLSTVGGPTPGYKYCMDGSMGGTDVPLDQWVTVGMSYDGTCGYSWLNGLLDAHPTLNPYPIGELNDGGPNGSDFTVGAVDRSGEIGNFFCGSIAGLAIYDRALTPAEVYAVCKTKQTQCVRSSTR